MWWSGSSPGGEGVVVRWAAAFPAASSVGVARSPRVGVPSLPPSTDGVDILFVGFGLFTSQSRFQGFSRDASATGKISLIYAQKSLMKSSTFWC